MQYDRIGLRLASAMFVASTLIGCNSTQLRYDTLRLGTTLPELQRRQVLDDIGILAANPRDLPYFALVYGGTASVTDQGSGSLSFVGVVGKYTQGTYGLSGQRQITGNWSVKPINDPYRLAAIRCACLLALGRDDMIESIDLQRLNALLGQNYPGYNGDPREVIPTGWLCTGDKRDKPKNWPYFATSGGQCVWVKQDRFRDYTNFVLVVLDLATIASGAARDLPQEIAPAKDDKTTTALKDFQNDLKLIKEQFTKAKTQEAKKQLIDNAAEQQKQARSQLVLPEMVDLSHFGNRLNSLQLDATDAPQATTIINQFGTSLDDTINKVQQMINEQQTLERERPVRSREISPLPPRIDDSPPSVNPGLFFIPRPT